MRSVREALPAALTALGISRRTRAAQAVWLWPQVVGPVLAEQTRAIELRGGTLWVSATSAPLAHQLHLERQGLVERLNRAIGAPAVKDIRSRQAVWR